MVTLKSNEMKYLWSGDVTITLIIQNLMLEVYAKVCSKLSR